MHSPRAALLAVALLALCAWCPRGFAAQEAQEQDREGAEFFEKRIRPLLIDRCYTCHSAQAVKLKGHLLLDNRQGLLKGGDRGPAVVPGDPNHSLLLAAVRQREDEIKMPPRGKRLSPEQVADVEAWIARGAPTAADHGVAPAAQGLRSPEAMALAGRGHWAFRPPIEPSLPEVKQNDWPQSPLDRFILAKLEAKFLRPSPPADKRTLLRRVTFDLTGLPPTPEEIDAFQADPSADAYEKVVDRLLASPRYGERWARYWLDVARYSDTKGYIYGDRDQERFVQAYAYRDWVIDAFNRDLPYDQFLIQQIAGDRVAREGDLSPLAAMGFLTVGRRFLYVVHDVIDDLIDVVGRGTMGLTLSCARCHDHKFDPIPIQDYYSLYGIFRGSVEKTKPLVEAPERTPAYLAYKKELDNRQRKFRETFQAKSEKLLERLRSKITDYLVAVVDAEKLPTEEFYIDLGPDDINPVIAHGIQSYLLATAKEFHPIFAPWHAFLSMPRQDLVRQAPAWIAKHGRRLNPKVAEIFAGAPPESMKEVASRYGELLTRINARWQELLQKAARNGAPAPARLPDPAEEELRQILYGPHSPVALPPKDFSEIQFFFDESTRVEVGRLQADVERWEIEAPGAVPQAVYLEDRPLQSDPHVFRRGNPAVPGEEVPRRFLALLSKEPREPFREGSGRLELARAIASPDNPLTARVMVNRVWAHHFGKGIVTTPSDFGLRSDPPSHAELLDWLARRFVEGGWSLKKLHRRILLSSTYRQASADNSAAAAVDPDNRLLWRMNRQRLDFEAMRDAFLAVSGRLDLSMGGRPVTLDSLPFSGRRSVYGQVDRLRVSKMMRLFDFANPDSHSAQRYQTTIPQQALFLMNSPFVLEQACALANRPDISAASDADRRIETLYRLLYGRSPGPREREIGRRALSEPAATSPAIPPSRWQYGFGEVDLATGRTTRFEPLRYFVGEEWRSWRDWPTAEGGKVRLGALGGHPGSDLAHAVIRRWVAPSDGVASLSGTVRCEAAEGDGIHARVIFSRTGELGSFIVRKTEADAAFRGLEVKQGEFLDFVVDCRADDAHDSFAWAPVVHLKNPKTGQVEEWNSAIQFAGPPPPILGPLERYAQALLLANEFVFVD